MRSFIVTVSAALVLLSASICWADPPTAAPGDASAPATAAPANGAPTKAAPLKFIRVKRDKEGEPLALQTAVSRYVPASGEGDLMVELVAAVHMADRAYYQRMNDDFEAYDVLLYELVAPQGTRIPRSRRDADNPLAMLQQMSTMMLGLSSQTDEIDYEAENFVHADMSPEEMAEAIRKRGDDGLTLFLSIAADMLRQQNLQRMREEQNARPQRRKPQPEEPEDPLAALFDPQSPLEMKRQMAEQFDQLGPGGGLGNTLNTILVADRNKAAIRVFQRELAQGRKRIGIFYGAAHMPDFHTRLTRDFGLKLAEQRWVTAWDLRPGRGQRGGGLESLLRMLLEE